MKDIDTGWLFEAKGRSRRAEMGGASRVRKAVVDLRPPGGHTPEPRYELLSSVWYGEEDAALLERLLRFYPRKRPRRVLDATINGGRFWRGSNRRVVGLDIESNHKPSIVGDNGSMPFRPGAFEVVVY